MKTINAYLFVSVAIATVYFCAAANLRLKRSETGVDSNLDSDGRCVTARNWMEDCNQCFCVENSVPACTEKGCIHSPILISSDSEPTKETTGGRSKRSDSEIDSNLDSNGRCVTARNWMEDCNQCFCVENSVPACTEKGCIHSPILISSDSEPTKETTGDRSKRSDSEVDSNLDSNGRCVTARNWMEDCNQCFCVENSVPACTLKGCIHLPLPEFISVQPEPTREAIAVKVKRSDSESTAETKCKPGSEWKDACNSCWCNDDGHSYCTKRGCVDLGGLTTKTS